MSRRIWSAIRWNLVKNWVMLPPIILLPTKLTSRKLLSSIAKPLKFVCSDLKARVPGAQIVANQEGTVLDKAISVGEKLIISTPDLNAIMGESGGATLGAVKAVRNQNQAGKIAVFGSDMTTEIAQELENNQVLKAVVDISGKKMGNAVFAQTLKVINMDFSEFVFLVQ